MADIGTTWLPNTWVSSGGWALHTWGDAQPPSEEVGPVCAAVDATFGVLGTVEIEGCTVPGLIIAPGNDTPFKLIGAQDEGTDDYLNSATVNFTVYATNGTTIIAGPTTMDYVATTNGNYRGVLESSVVAALMTAGTMVLYDSYPVKITLTSGTLNAEWDQLVPLLPRGWNC